jgi:hypothetical protein
MLVGERSGKAIADTLVGDVRITWDKIVFSLDALIAGAKYKGEFEERLKSVVKEVTAAEGDIVYLLMRFTRSLVLAVARCYGCSKYFEASFGSWRTALLVQPP